MIERVRHGPRRRAALACVAVVLVVLSGCGTPEYTYVTNSEDHTYLRIPYSWRPIDERALGEAVGLDPNAKRAQSGF